jgi:hypothetical protein
MVVVADGGHHQLGRRSERTADGVTDPPFSALSLAPPVFHRSRRGEFGVKDWTLESGAGGRRVGEGWVCCAVLFP